MWSRHINRNARFIEATRLLVGLSKQSTSRILRMQISRALKSSYSINCVLLKEQIRHEYLQRRCGRLHCHCPARLQHKWNHQTYQIECYIKQFDKTQIVQGVTWQVWKCPVCHSSLNSTSDKSKSTIDDWICSFCAKPDEDKGFTAFAIYCYYLSAILCCSCCGLTRPCFRARWTASVLLLSDKENVRALLCLPIVA